MLVRAVSSREACMFSGLGERGFLRCDGLPGIARAGISSLGNRLANEACGGQQEDDGGSWGHLVGEKLAEPAMLELLAEDV